MIGLAVPDGSFSLAVDRLGVSRLYYSREHESARTTEFRLHYRVRWGGAAIVRLLKMMINLTRREISKMRGHSPLGAGLVTAIQTMIRFQRCPPC
jgi:hypothetical protein